MKPVYTDLYKKLIGLNGFPVESLMGKLVDEGSVWPLTDLLWVAARWSLVNPAHAIPPSAVTNHRHRPTEPNHLPFKFDFTFQSSIFYSSETWILIYGSDKLPVNCLIHHIGWMKLTNHPNPIIPSPSSSPNIYWCFRSPRLSDNNELVEETVIISNSTSRVELSLIGIKFDES